MADVTDTPTSNNQCIIPIGTDLSHRNLTVDHHLVGQPLCLVRTCPDPQATSCPNAYTIDYPATVHVDMHEQRQVSAALGMGVGMALARRDVHAGATLDTRPGSLGGRNG